MILGFSIFDRYRLLAAYKKDPAALWIGDGAYLAHALATIRNQ